ncbi:hypothetical protein WG70_22760 [Burkholderia oklahomensis EO147]|nr:hypothetical protein WG70_22760 [Burkholderia oklahomensis EO147]AOI45979.1 hypothetical protein WI23_09390 [Burkholderia oklahomensis C6786]KUY54708.1 hypothetical protein WI23_21695 [Burkholderia oklahomensis C6786]KUY68698.1 hypothetical protein WG70_24265 [Burkholderia oklahomensis EO147]
MLAECFAALLGEARAIAMRDRQIESVIDRCSRRMTGCAWTRTHRHEFTSGPLRRTLRSPRTWHAGPLPARDASASVRPCFRSATNHDFSKMELRRSEVIATRTCPTNVDSRGR